MEHDPTQDRVVSGTVSYGIDEQDRIVTVGDEWDRFAQENEAHGLIGSSVLNRSLWSFISDETTRHLFKTIVKRCRHGRTIRLAYRCDSPAVRRYMEMTVEPGEKPNWVLFRCRTMREEPRSLPRAPAAGISSRAAMIRMCGWCNRVEVSGNWMEVEQAALELNLFDEPTLPMITHGICRECLEEVSGTLESE